MWHMHCREFIGTYVLGAGCARIEKNDVPEHEMIHSEYRTNRTRPLCGMVVSVCHAVLTGPHTLQLKCAGRCAVMVSYVFFFRRRRRLRWHHRRYSLSGSIERQRATIGRQNTFMRRLPDINKQLPHKESPIIGLYSLLCSIFNQKLFCLRPPNYCCVPRHAEKKHKHES